MAYLLGIDLGTSSVRSIFIDTDGEVVALAGEEYPILTPSLGYAEQDPTTWWAAACRTVSKVLTDSGISPRDIKGIGLSGQMHGLVLVDGAGIPVRPAIIWPDRRSSAECKELTERVGVDTLYRITGLPAATGFMASSLLWAIHHEPHLFAQPLVALSPKDYLRLKLTGKMATDVTDAAGTLFLDIRRRAWSYEVIRAAGVPEELFPKLYESECVVGEVTHEAARETGLIPGTPVIAGGGDQAMGAIGYGLIAEGVAASTIGTGGQFLTCVSQPVLDPKRRIHTLCHAIPGRWLLMGAILSAGLSLRWFRDNLGQLERALGRLSGIDPYELLSQEAAAAPPGSLGLIFLPYLAGERTPHMDPNLRGAFIGLTLQHTRAHMIRAVMEGVGFAMRESLEIFGELGVVPRNILSSGGGARSPLWRQIQADIYAMPVMTVGGREHSAYGAALLAGVGIGVYRDVEEAIQGRVKYGATVSPDEGATRVYRSAFDRYRTLSSILKGFFGGWRD